MQKDTQFSLGIREEPLPQVLQMTPKEGVKLHFY